MALPPSYVPRDVPRSMPLPNPANPGRFVAAGLQQAGNVAVGVVQGEQETQNRVAEIQYQQERQSQSADFAARFSGRDDGSFRIAATFLNAPGGADLVRGILNGPDALKAHQQLWAAEKAKKVFDQYTGVALAGMPADYAADTFDAAKHFYAYRMAQAGATGWSEDAWRGAVEATLGGFTQGGEHKGGTAMFNSQRVIIPSGWTADGVFRRFARASGAEWSKAAGNVQPQWPDGSDVTAPDLRKLLPVYVGGTRYAFRTRAGNFLQVKGGGTFVVDAAQVPWK